MDSDVIEVLVLHRFGEFRTRRDGEPEAGWYCRCGQIYARNLAYNPEHLAKHQLKMLKELKCQDADPQTSASVD